jgi:Rieske 2Fe-2S family protein
MSQNHGPLKWLGANARPSARAFGTTNAQDIIQLLNERKPNHSLPGALYWKEDVFKAELEHLWYREWLFAGVECEIVNAGDLTTFQLGAYPLLLVRGHDNVIRGFHNICRHRGFKLCNAAKGNVVKRIKCPYHQWTYELDGALAFAKDCDTGFRKEAYGLKPIHVECVAGYIFISVASSPPSFEPIRAMFEPYIAPFHLRSAKVAFESRIIEQGNWKIAWQNNRECYHCKGAHPELTTTFPDSPYWNGGPGQSEKERQIVAAMLSKCEAMGLPSQYQVAGSHQHRIMRIPFKGDGRSMTLTGEPAVATKRLVPSLPLEENIGNVLFYHYPSTWNHFQADHALSFRMLPISPTETEIVTKWLVPKDAVEGLDYDLKTLTEVWIATNAQDQVLVQTQQEGVTSPAYEPGPYSSLQEEGVIRFDDWYCEFMKDRLRGSGMLENDTAHHEIDTRDDQESYRHLQIG